MYQYPKDEILIKSVRDGLVDEVHSGFVVFADSKGYKNIKGMADDYPFYMRSCAKPLQASLITDYGLDEFYQMTEEEIALCCASHAGEKVHTDVIKGFLDKIGLDESYLKCGVHEPLSKTRQKELLIENYYNEILRLPRHSEAVRAEDESVSDIRLMRAPKSPKNLTNQAQNDNFYKLSALHNNCSGKHTMMLALCKMNGWDLNTYDEPNHPLQIAIKKKIYELCEVECEYPVTTDGCGVPIVSMPLHNMLRGYLNLFCDEKYKKIRNAFLSYPYLIGGEDRTDTKIIIESGKFNVCPLTPTLSRRAREHQAVNVQERALLVAKVGAGGLCIVVNYKKSEAFVVKVSDCDMKSRELVAMNMINELKWADIKIDNTVKTLHGKQVGYYDISPLN